MVTLFIQIHFIFSLFLAPFDQPDDMQVARAEDTPMAIGQSAYAVTAYTGVDLLNDDDDPVESVDQDITIDYTISDITDNMKAAVIHKGYGDVKGRSPPLAGISKPPSSDERTIRQTHLRFSHEVQPHRYISRKDLFSSGRKYGTHTGFRFHTDCAAGSRRTARKAGELHSSLLYSTVIGLFGHSHANQNPFNSTTPIRYRPISVGPGYPGIYYRSGDSLINSCNKMRNAVCWAFLSDPNILPCCAYSFRL